MKLEKRFTRLVTTWDCYNDEPVSDKEVVKDTKKCAKIAEEFAMKFAHFLRTQCIPSSDYLGWFYEGKFYNEKKMLVVFKKEKKL